LTYISLDFLYVKYFMPFAGESYIAYKYIYDFYHKALPKK